MLPWEKRSVHCYIGRRCPEKWERALGGGEEGFQRQPVICGRELSWHSPVWGELSPDLTSGGHSAGKEIQ